MKNSPLFPTSSREEQDVGSETADGTETEILKKNPKIDWRLLEEHARLVTASNGIVRSRKQGADYNIAHPLARKDMPTDAYHRGQRVREENFRRQR